MRPAGFAALIVLSLGVVGYTIAVYALLPLGAAVHPDMRVTFWLCWVPNLIVAELLFNSARGSGVPRRQEFDAPQARREPTCK